MSSNLGLVDYEFYFGPAGGTGGLEFGIGHFVDVMSIDGITDLEVLYSDMQHLLHHGDIPGVHLAVGKVVRFELEIRKATQTDTQWRDLIRSVESAFSVLTTEEQELHWKLPGETERFLRGRPVRRRRIIDPDSELGICSIEVELRQADPRYYTATKSTDNNNSGTFTVNNTGPEDAYPLITFDTGVGNSRGRIINNDTGVVLDVVDGYGTDQLGYADMDKYIRGDQGAIIYDHLSVSKYGAWVPPRTPFYLRPGNNSVSLTFGQTVSFEWWATHL